MDHTFRSLVLLLRLSIGALALTLAMLTAAAQGMPMPLSWPAVLLECVLAVAALFLHRPPLGSGLTFGRGLDNTSARNTV